MDSNYIGTISDIYFLGHKSSIQVRSTYIYEDVLSGIRVAKDDETIDAYSIGNITIRPGISFQVESYPLILMYQDYH